jgi:hypothetical protein
MLDLRCYWESQQWTPWCLTKLTSTLRPPIVDQDHVTWRSKALLERVLTDNGEHVRGVVQDVGESNDCDRVHLMRVGNPAEHLGVLDLEFSLFSAGEQRAQSLALLLLLLHLSSYCQLAIFDEVDLVRACFLDCKRPPPAASQMVNAIPKCWTIGKMSRSMSRIMTFHLPKEIPKSDRVSRVMVD